MEKRLSHEELKEMYQESEINRWREITSDDEVDHPHFQTYLNQKQRLKNMLPYISVKPGSTVAEYGCGNGIFGEMICSEVEKYVGVDFSEYFIELAEKRFQKLGIRNAEFHAEEIAAFSASHQNEYDQAFALDFSEHIYDDVFLEIFRAIKNTMKPGGELIIHTPNGNYFLEILKNKGVLKQIEGHIGVRTARHYKKLIDQLGFSKVKITFIPHYLPALRRVHFLSHLPLIGKYFQARLLIFCKK